MAKKKQRKTILTPERAVLAVAFCEVIVECLKLLGKVVNYGFRFRELRVQI
jgi:hypothetical protein